MQLWLLIFLKIFSQEANIFPKFQNIEPVMDQINTQSYYERKVIDNLYTSTQQKEYNYSKLLAKAKLDPEKFFQNYKDDNFTIEEAKVSKSVLRDLLISKALLDPEKYFHDYIHAYFYKYEAEVSEAVLDYILENDLLNNNILKNAEDLKRELFDLFYDMNKFLSTKTTSSHANYELGPFTCVKKFCAELNERFISENTEFSKMKKQITKLISLTSYFANKDKDLKDSFVKMLDAHSSSINSMFLGESLAALSRIEDPANLQIQAEISPSELIQIEPSRPTARPKGTTITAILKNKILELTLPYIKPSVIMQSVVRLGPSKTQLDQLQKYILGLLYSRGEIEVLKDLNTDKYFQSVLLADSKNFLKAVNDEKINNFAYNNQRYTDFLKTFADLALFTSRVGVKTFTLEGNISKGVLQPIKIPSYNFVGNPAINIEIPATLIAPAYDVPLAASISNNTLQVVRSGVATASYLAKNISNQTFEDDKELYTSYSILFNNYLSASLSSLNIFKGLRVQGTETSLVPLKDFTSQFYFLNNFINGNGALGLIIEGDLFNTNLTSRIYIAFTATNFVATIDNAYIISDASSFNSFSAAVKPVFNYQSKIIDGTASLINEAELSKFLNKSGLSLARQIEVNNAFKNLINYNFTDFSVSNIYTKVEIIGGNFKLSKGISIDGNFIETVDTFIKTNEGILRAAAITLTELGIPKTLDLTVSEMAEFTKLMGQIKNYCSI